jgi:hypothetical protein
MRVEWVHPSWRDVVIEALARDDTARRRFLAHCGVDGAALALSEAGGAAGERVRPLLRGDADWDALGDGLHRLCPELSEAGAVQLLTVLAAGEPDPELSALAELVARRLAAQWREHVVGVDALVAWAAVAGRLPRRPPAPPVAPTWHTLAPQHAPREPAEVERFADWLRLAELLERHDPELLAGLGFPEHYAPLLDDFASATPRDEPPVEHELRLQALGRLQDLYPRCTGPALESVNVLSEDDEPLLAATAPVADGGGFPVARVLRDLAE